MSKFAYTEKPVHGGVQRLFKFDNGYEASVVRHPYSYGGRNGLWELAVIHGGHLCYDTPVTPDVEGHLSWEAVEVLLEAINALPAR